MNDQPPQFPRRASACLSRDGSVHHAPAPGSVDDPRARPVRQTVSAAIEHALRHAGYEVLPLRNAAQTVCSNVPVEVPLTVTMTASKGLDATLDLTEALAAQGYRVTPHIAARMVRDGAHLADIVARLAAHRVDGLFVIAGDIPQPVGPFTDSLDLLDALATLGHPFRRIGVGGYPEGHASLSQALIDEALIRKASHATHVVTQMCFRSSATTAWAHQIKRRGINLPVQVGLPGAVTRHKLARISATLGLGPSARYLMKQNSMLLRFFLPGGYSPDRLISGLGPTLAEGDSNLVGFHFFTFNEVARTEAWRQAWLHRLRSDTA